MKHLPFALFDMDGTLVDSMTYWRMAHIEGMEAAGYTVTDGMKEALKKVWGYENLQSLLANWGIHKTIEKLKEDARRLLCYHYEHDIVLKPGTLALLDEMRAAGVKMGVLTLTPHALAEICLAKNGIREYFSCIITTEDNPTGTGKEAPEIFRVALDALGCEQPQDCAVYEDSFYSIHTAHQMGFYVVGVEDQWQSPKQKEQMRAICDLVLDLDHQ